MTLPGCDAIYYRTMKKFGVEKRDILVNRVRDAREAQQKGKEEFKTALERFKAVVETDGGALEDKFNKLNKELERCEDRAKQIHDRVKAVKDVADDLFDEWQKELVSTRIERCAAKASGSCARRSGAPRASSRRWRRPTSASIRCCNPCGTASCSSSTT